MLGLRAGLMEPSCWVQLPGFPLTGCVTVGKRIHCLPKPQFPCLYFGLVIVLILVLLEWLSSYYILKNKACIRIPGIYMITMITMNDWLVKKGRWCWNSSGSEVSEEETHLDIGVCDNGKPQWDTCSFWRRFPVGAVLSQGDSKNIHVVAGQSVLLEWLTHSPLLTGGVKSNWDGLLDKTGELLIFSALIWKNFLNK